MHGPQENQQQLYAHIQITGDMRERPSVTVSFPPGQMELVHNMTGLRLFTSSRVGGWNAVSDRDRVGRDAKSDQHLSVIPGWL